MVPGDQLRVLVAQEITPPGEPGGVQAIARWREEGREAASDCTDAYVSVSRHVTAKENTVTPEGKVKEAVKKLLKERGAYYHMPVQNGMGKPSLDFVGCYKGKFFAIETKAEGKKPTLRQQATIAEMEAAGAAVFVVAGDFGMDELRWWLGAPEMPA